MTICHFFGVKEFHEKIICRCYFGSIASLCTVNDAEMGKSRIFFAVKMNFSWVWVKFEYNTYILIPIHLTQNIDCSCSIITDRNEAVLFFNKPEESFRQSDPVVILLEFL